MTITIPRDEASILYAELGALAGVPVRTPPPSADPIVSFNLPERLLPTFLIIVGAFRAELPKTAAALRRRKGATS